LHPVGNKGSEAYAAARNDEADCAGVLLGRMEGRKDFEVAMSVAGMAVRGDVNRSDGS
jgi:hypothetical protein